MALIKICGITNVEDALAAVDCGADMLGFVFAPSPRRISPENASAICAALPRRITKVGVFVDESISLIEKIASQCKLDCVQLHGSETPEYASELTLPFIKAFRSRDESVLEEIKSFKAGTFLLDSYHPSKQGGTGEMMDIALATKAAKLGRMILAGGLNSENVRKALLKVKPYGVDVSSGVEISPGKKDKNKIRKFIQEVRECSNA